MLMREDDMSGLACTRIVSLASRLPDGGNASGNDQVIWIKPWFVCTLFMSSWNSPCQIEQRRTYISLKVVVLIRHLQQEIRKKIVRVSEVVLAYFTNFLYLI